MTPTPDPTGKPEARVIKFRIWNPEQNEWMESGGTPTMLSSFFLRSAKAHAYYGMQYQQFTGLFDRTGKEIYEGDVCTVEYRDGESETMRIEWDEELARFRFVDSHGEAWTITQTRIEVIGNIMQNQGLLA